MLAVYYFILPWNNIVFRSAIIVRYPVIKVKITGKCLISQNCLEAPDISPSTECRWNLLQISSLYVVLAYTLNTQDKVQNGVLFIQMFISQIRKIFSVY